nr:Rieske 2Fe-2S domain-containing protein [Candidatus Sigynarchaeum springense]
MVLVKACDVAAFPKDGRLGFSARAIEVAIFKVEGTFFALERHCPHAGGDLVDGMIEKGLVECPIHGATFDLRTGKFVQSEYVSPHLAKAMHDTRSFPVVIKDGALLVDIP